MEEPMMFGLQTIVVEWEGWGEVGRRAKGTAIKYGKEGGNIY